MRSFLVGGAGFIGSHLADQLVLRGPVTVFDNLSVGKARVHRRAPGERRGHAGAGRRARSRDAHPRDEGPRRGLPPRRQPRGALGSRAHPARSRAGHHRHVQLARGGAPQRREEVRLLLERHRLRQQPGAVRRDGPRHPPLLALRRQQARRRDAHRVVRRVLRPRPRTPAASATWSVRAERTAPSSTSARSSRRTPSTSTSSATGVRPSRISSSPTAPPASSTCSTTRRRS